MRRKIKLSSYQLAAYALPSTYTLGDVLHQVWECWVCSMTGVMMLEQANVFDLLERIVKGYIISILL